MYFDAPTLAAVADELRETVIGGRIQRALLPSPLSVALEIFAYGRRRYLLLSAHPQFARIHLTDAKPSRGVERATPLLLLLRKYVVGGQIVAIENPDLERVLLLSIVKATQPRNTGSAALDDSESDDQENSFDAVLTETMPADDADELPDDGFDMDEPPDDDRWANALRCDLVVEAMERRGNVVLVGDNNVILESLRHVTPRMSRRPVQPREPYELPPRQEKRDPRQTTPDGLRVLLEGKETNLARALVNTYRGLSPQAAREAAFRATGAADAQLDLNTPWARLALAVRALFEEDEPCLTRGEDGEPQAYAPYELTHLPGAEPIRSMSAALDAFYRAREPFASHQQRRDALRDQLADARARFARQQRHLADELARAGELERLRWEGEMIYGFMHTLVPKQTQLIVEDRTIELDPGMTPVENAQERFRAYDKAKSALSGVPERLAAVEARLAGLDELVALLDVADGFEQIEGIARDAVALDYVRPPARRAKVTTLRQTPLRVVSHDGSTIYVGRSASQNETVTFRIGTAGDTWLHVRGMPGAHVIVKASGGEVNEETLLEAAALAAYYSKARNESAVEIDVARRTQVRRVPSGPPGLATYTAERTVRVAPRPPADTTR